MYNNIELYYEPRSEIMSKLNFPSSEPEMSEFDHAFLCGIIRSFRPQKILEVGIAGGGQRLLSCNAWHY